MWSLHSKHKSTAYKASSESRKLTIMRDISEGNTAEINQSQQPLPQFSMCNKLKMHVIVWQNIQGIANFQYKAPISFNLIKFFNVYRIWYETLPLPAWECCPFTHIWSSLKMFSDACNRTTCQTRLYFAACWAWRRSSTYIFSLIQSLL